MEKYGLRALARLPLGAAASRRLAAASAHVVRPQRISAPQRRRELQR
jgi:hypothetical protein